MNNYTNELSNEQLQLSTPSVFSPVHKETLSKHYSFMPTTNIVDLLKAKGWVVVSANQVRSKRADALFKRHMVRLRHSSNLASNPEFIPEMVVVNSHDGTSTLQLHLGMFRLACSNGLVIADSTFSSIKFRHMGFTPDQVIDASFKILEAAPESAKFIEHMSSVNLTDEKKLELASQSLQLKYDDASKAPIEFKQLLEVRREADKGNDAWSVFNVVQENLMRGGQSNDVIKARTLAATGKHGRSSRSVNAVKEQLRINKGLWELFANASK